MPQVNLRLDDECYAAVEAARGDVPRNRWLVRAVEALLAEPISTTALRHASQPVGDQAHGRGVESIRSSAQAKRGVKPIERKAR